MGMRFPVTAWVIEKKSYASLQSYFFQAGMMRGAPGTYPSGYLM
jgi:hypothetical protein